MARVSGQESRCGICRSLEKVLNTYGPLRIVSQRDIKTWERRILAHLCRTAQRKRFRVAGLTVILDLILVINGAAFLRRQFCEKKVICCATLTKMWPIKYKYCLGEYQTPMLMLFPKTPVAMPYALVAMQMKIRKDRECDLVPMLMRSRTGRSVCRKKRGKTKKSKTPTLCSKNR